MTEIGQVLSDMQRRLKAPKTRKGPFGNHRNAEDILEAYKQIAPEGASIRCTDDVVAVSDKVYIKATAILRYKGEEIAVTAMAREPSVKTRLDDSQITGCASSYARKYALNGLFAIDDTKDADNMEHKESSMSPKMQEFVRLVNEKKIQSETITKWKEWAGVQNTKDIPDDKLSMLIAKMKEKV